MGRYQSTEVRFWSKVKRADGDGCWVWIGAKTERGYGQFKYGNRQMGAHRASLLLHGVDVPKGMYVCHKCDNPPCVRPDHLFIGTATDNCQDRKAKGRYDYGSDHWTHKQPHRLARGERSSKAKLTADQVRSLRADRASGMSYDALAAKYGLTKCPVANICKRKSWRHVA